MTGTTRVAIDPDGVRDVARRLRGDGDGVAYVAGWIGHTGTAPPGIDRRLAAIAAWCDRAADELEHVAEDAARADDGWFDDPVGESVHHLARFGGGLGEGGVSVVVAAVDLVSIWRGSDWLHDRAQDLAGLAYGARLLADDPAAFAALVADLEGLRSDPAHWLGTRVGAWGVGAGAWLGSLRLADNVADLRRHTRFARERVAHTRMASPAHLPGPALHELFDLRPRLTRFAVVGGTDGLLGGLRAARRDGDPLGLVRHEARGGTDPHTLRDHVGLSVEQLHQRLELETATRLAKGEGPPGSVSTFDSYAVSIRALAEAIDARRADIERWLREGRGTCVKFTHVASWEIGDVLLRGRADTTRTRRLQVVLDLHPNPGPGEDPFVVRTGYPLPDGRTTRSPSPC